MGDPVTQFTEQSFPQRLNEILISQLPKSWQASYSRHLYLPVEWPNDEIMRKVCPRISILSCCRCYT